MWETNKHRGRVGFPAGPELLTYGFSLLTSKLLTFLFRFWSKLLTIPVFVGNSPHERPGGTPLAPAATPSRILPYRQTSLPDSAPSHARRGVKLCWPRRASPPSHHTRTHAPAARVVPSMRTAFCDAPCRSAYRTFNSARTFNVLN